MAIRETTAEPGPALPEVRMHLHSPADPATGTVVSSERCTASRKAAHFVRHIAIDVSGTHLAGNFRSGQSFGVIPPGHDAQGRPHKLRLYSIAAPTSGEDGKGQVVSTTVKRTIDEHHDTNRLFLGVASNYLCDLKPGDKVTLTGPAGKRFVLPADPGEHDYLFFATGTGIAPFRGMLLDVLAASTPCRITLVMGVAYATDLLYHEQFTRLAAEYPNFRYLTAISRQPQEDGHPPMYVQDRLRVEPGLRDMAGGSRTLIYICGLAGMELGIFQRLAEVIPSPALDRYLRIDAEAATSPASWTRSMIHKQVRPTRNVFMEVY